MLGLATRMRPNGSPYRTRCSASCRLLLRRAFRRWSAAIRPRPSTHVRWRRSRGIQTVLRRPATGVGVIATAYFLINAVLEVSPTLTALQWMRQWTSAAPQLRVVCTGHADLTGDRAANLALSKKRAQAWCSGICWKAVCCPACVELFWRGALQIVALWTDGWRWRSL